MFVFSSRHEILFFFSALREISTTFSKGANQKTSNLSSRSSPDCYWRFNPSSQSSFYAWFIFSFFIIPSNIHISFPFRSVLTILSSAINTVVQKSSEGHSSMSDDIGRAVPVHASNIDHYQQKENYTMVNKSWIQITLYTTSTKITAARWSSFLKTKLLLCMQHNDGVLFVYCQPERDHKCYCDGHRWRHEDPERQLFYGTALWFPSAPLCSNVTKRRWNGVSFSSNAHAIQVLCWQQRHVVSSGNQTEHNREHLHCDCAKQSDNRRQEAETGELRASVQRELWRTLY